MSDKTRICLVNPPLEGPYPPLGLAYLASYLKKYEQGKYILCIIDGNHSKDVVRDILAFKPDIVGFTALSPQIALTVKFSRIIRGKAPQIFQIIGGIHVSAEPEQTLRKGSFDIGILGEGEETFREVVGLVRGGRQGYEAFRSVAGLAFIKGVEFIRTPSRPEIMPLESIPVPDRSLFNMERYLSHYLVIRGLSGNRITTLHTSRGCPYDCVFCSCGIVFKKVRYFPVDYVIAEVKELIRVHKVKSLFFTDDTFIINKDRVRQICNRFIAEGINKQLKWEVQGRANLIDWQDLDLLKLMKDAGCVQVDYGFETGSDKILKFLKKTDVSIDFNQRAIEVTKDAGLKVMGTFMVGIPGESEDDLLMTRDFIIRNISKIDHFQTFIATPYPGAELNEICKERGLVEADYFAQFAKEQANPCAMYYCDTVSQEKAISVQKFLNKLALDKVSLKDKALWLMYNLVKSPIGVFRKVTGVFKKA
ncbi:MAG: radical SAM protein [Candidatus Omnitrophica bacterium]|nr:radical SAM protein [Candidatus Omnitrophota bacterium]